jgi:endonuclease-3 related protein
VKPAPGFRALYERLLGVFGEQRVWSTQGPFVVMVGSVLTQNTAWSNVEKSLSNLRESGLLIPEQLACVNQQDLELLIRPSGFMKAKAATCIRLASWVVDNAPMPWEAADSVIAGCTTAELRSRLLAITGIGPETADDIVLFAFDRPTFIWDTYARRTLAAVGYSVKSGYESTRTALQSELDEAEFSTEELKQFHELILLSGKRARKEGWGFISETAPS